jgi:hypothetical protein
MACGSWQDWCLQLYSQRLIVKEISLKLQYGSLGQFKIPILAGCKIVLFDHFNDQKVQEAQFIYLTKAPLFSCV